MTSYRRGPFGLVALLALIISLAHSVWALCCLVDAGPMTAEIVVAEAHHASVHRGSHRELSPSVPHHDPTHECPQGQAGILGGCAVSAAIPTGTLPVVSVPFEGSDPIAPPVTLPQIIFGTDLFRPPRA